MDLEVVQNKIFQIRGHRVMLDFHLAEMYEVETKVFNQAVKRNIDRFPIDFMIRLSPLEWQNMRSQFVTASQSKRNITQTPYAFTEQGVAMLSAILNSKKAVDVSIELMRAFVMLRKVALGHKDILDKIEAVEAKYDNQFSEVFKALKYLLEPPTSERNKIGF